MTPEASRRRTRSSDARGESPTVCASFWMVERPSRWSAARILTSMRSRAGGRLAAIDVYFLTIDTEDSFRNAPQSLIDPKLPAAHCEVVQMPGYARVSPTLLP